jgi:amino acid adenylation domain-containing protein
MTTADFLSELRTRDVRCWVEGDRLRLSVPRGALTPQLQEELARRKPEIVSYLRTSAEPDGRSVPRIEPQPRHRPLPLSFAQERLWFLQRFDPDSTAWNLQASVSLRGALDRGALERTLAELVRRHETLRTTFAEGDGGPVQVTAAAGPVDLPTVELRGRGDDERWRDARRLATEDVKRPFDLGRGPLFRALLLRLGDEHHELLVTQHHIVTDGWSIALLVQEVLALYAAFAAGRPSPLPALPVQYADFAQAQRQWLRGAVHDRLLEYWKRRLREPLPVLDLPTDRPRPPVQTSRGATLRFEVSPRLAERAKALSRRCGATPFMTLLAAFQALLCRHTGQDDVVVGTANGSRPWLETEGLLGLFVNTVAIRTDLSGDPPFLEALARVRQVALEAYAHGEMPFERLVEELRPRRDLSRTPLFQALFVLQNTPLEAVARSADAERDVIGERTTAAYELSLYLIESNGGYTATLEYNTDLFDRETVARMADRYLRLLDSAVERPESRLSELSVLPGAERRTLLVDWNDTARETPSGTVCEWFETRARRRPESPAVVGTESVLTYGELSRRSSRLARRLRDSGVSAGARVAVYVDRSPDLLVALLGVLKAGAAYVPLDPAYPPRRLALMLEDAAPRLVLTQERLRESLPGTAAEVLCLDGPATLSPRSSRGRGDAIASPQPSSLGRPDSIDSDSVTEGPEVPIHPEDTAYLIYTSGSTGRPKGVEVPHRALTNLLASMAAEPGLAENDVLVAVTTLSFDIAALELFLPLVTGATVVLADRETASDGVRLAALLASSGATVLQATPATWRLLIEAGWTGDRRLKALCGGEALPADLARELGRRCRELWNVYGPTETTIWSTAVRLDEGAPVTIGRPIANTRVYVLDERLQPAPVGVQGELFIGGAGVAHGYRGRADLTAERFLPDPYTTGPGARLYRTGDRARWREGGLLECLGRLDGQVKLRGFRIELGDVETAAAEHPSVRECVAVVREDVPGDRVLVAYVVPSPAGAPSVAAFRAFLRERLPEFMVPSSFVPLEALPRTPNGKVDRRALPAPDRTRPEREHTYVPPRDAVEEALAGIFQEVLGRERVGAHDDFFDLGGHSLRAAQVASRVREALGVELPLRQMFESPTPAGLAEAVAGLRGRAPSRALPPLVSVPRDRPIPLSFAQERLWFLEQIDPGTAAYNMPGAVRIRGPVDEAALARSLDELWRRHEALRTTFGAEDGAPYQRIGPPSGFRMDIEDLASLDATEREAHVRRRATDEARRPFDLARGPLFRARLLRLADDEHVLLLALHHIVGDGWSLGVILREAGLLYRAFAAGQPSPLPDLRLQYADFAVWQRRCHEGPLLEDQLAYWRRKLAGLPLLELPTDRPRPAMQTFAGALHHFWVAAPVHASLHGLARREGATLFMVLLAAFEALLARHSGQDDIVVGAPVAGRSREALEGLVGSFANTLVLRTDLSGDPTFRELVGRVREVVLEAFDHQEVPFEKLVEELRPARNFGVNPLFQVMFVLQNAPQTPVAVPKVQTAPVEFDPGTARLDLTVFLTETAQGILTTFEYNTDLFDRETIVRLEGRFRTLLRAAAEAPQRTLSELSLAGADEERQLRAWNTTALDVPRETLVHELFEAQARRTPGATAVDCEGDVLTYRALDGRADVVARALRALGVGPEVLVGLFLDRSLDMLVALLGVLKAGGAYVPLDPAYPRERLAFMLRDAGVRVVLTHGALPGQVPETDARVVRVEDLEADAARGVARSALTPSPLPEGEGGRDGRTTPLTPSPLPAPTPDDLAYVIYTSGSTGRPKGVQVPHRTLVNFLSSMRHAPGLEQSDVLLSVTTLSFDIAALELLLPLTVGARVSIATRDTATDPRRLMDALAATGATVLQATPATWRMLLEAGWTGTPGLRVLCGGEALPGDLARELLATGATVFNLYGPTETTVWSTVQAVDSTPSTVPLGRPIANTQVHVFDRRLRPMPVGVAGELFIGGDGVARDYRGRPDLTAERFVPDPFAARPGARLYRTGDLGRWRTDGVLEYLGRLDQQVKLRGFRIEPAEIEETLRELEGVASAAVLLRDDGADRRLVACVVLTPGLEPTVTELRAHLKERLPAYMIPSSFVVLDALPLTPNGKVDRRQLAAFEQGSDAAGATHAPPRTPMEELIARHWREALGVERVSRGDNFFDLGGHSLLSLRVLARIEAETGLRLHARDMIFQTLDQLAAACDERLGAERRP